MLLPELSLFEDREERKRAWQVAEVALSRKPIYWIVALGILAGFVALLFSLSSLGIPIQLRGYARWGLVLL